MMVWITQQTGQPRSRQSPTTSATSACSRGGIHGTFAAVGYIGHSGGALSARAGTLSRLAAVFAACCITSKGTKPSERENSDFSPPFAQTLEKLNDLARQRLPDAGGSGNPASSELSSEESGTTEEEDALEQLQDAFVQMMEVVRELAEELSTDALKLTSRFRCARTGIGFTRAERDEDEDEEESETVDGENELDLELELALVLQLFEEGRSRADDLPAVELQLDVDDFSHLHETLDFALNRERTSRRRRR